MNFVEPIRNGEGSISVSYKLGHPYRLAALHVGFNRVAGSGTDTAPLTVTRQGRHQDETFRLATIDLAGVNADVWIRVAADKKQAYEFQATDQFDVAWTSPDGNNIAWAMRLEWEGV